MSPRERRGPAPAKETGPLVAEITTTCPTTITELAEARQRRAARQTHDHLRWHGLDSEIVRRALGVAS